MSYVLLVIGFVLLIKGANYFVDGASQIAKLFRVSPMLIGLTIVAFGTSSPEVAVSISAAIKGSAEMVLGNVVGSIIFNITLVLGITAFIYPLKVESETIKKEIPFMLLASATLLVLVSDYWLQNVSFNVLTRADGLIFLLFLSVFTYYVIGVAQGDRKDSSAEASDHKEGKKKWLKHVLFTLGGLAGIIAGGEFVVRSSTTIAYSWGMSETLVGLTIIAIGTSLPELVTSITAAVKRQVEIAVGNVVGSNIFNIFFVLGVSSVISPLAVNGKILVDIWVMILFSLLMFVFSRTGYVIKKLEGSILVFVYIGYIVYIILRN